ncbi:AraC family transcriptional regulator [Rhodopseudomonas palustris]|uniref:helix-turn-helix domain-containing protein n=1 Tax=Rhodopseudomonas palustris TaxID=1076 RepID=UPI0020CE8D18|nr:AraC family transcriptional regulator [Rhodopseudomonas palustris]MCP9629436.1 AraC family transcriptional regulator [Rhodopseudomonas palustris]
MAQFEVFGDRKFPTAGLLLTSAGRDWSGVSAQLRNHAACDVPAPSPDEMEVTFAMTTSAGGRVERCSGGQFQDTAVRSGTLWFCPIGVREDAIRITRPLSNILHVFLAKSQFDSFAEMTSRTPSPANVAYLADVDDDLVRQLCLRMHRELSEETSGGKLLIECLSQALVAHLVTSYSGDAKATLGHDRVAIRLDDARLRRVLDYIHANIDQDLSLAKLSDVACLSKHHFARAFREATGVPPHRYISARRLDHAVSLLKGSQSSLADVAYLCRFSSQATFTRAFRRQVGMSPGEYRRRSST